MSYWSETITKCIWCETPFAVSKYPDCVYPDQPGEAHCCDIIIPENKIHFHFKDSPISYSWTIGQKAFARQLRNDPKDTSTLFSAYSERNLFAPAAFRAWIITIHSATIFIL